MLVAAASGGNIRVPLYHFREKFAKPKLAAPPISVVKVPMISNLIKIISQFHDKFVNKL
jgi:hypothetical protein